MCTTKFQVDLCAKLVIAQITGLQSRDQRHRSLTIDGSLFICFVLFVRPITQFFSFTLHMLVTLQRQVFPAAIFVSLCSSYISSRVASTSTDGFQAGVHFLSTFQTASMVASLFSRPAFRNSTDNSASACSAAGSSLADLESPAAAGSRGRFCSC